MLTTCVLLYGDFPSLARRCLRSIDPYVYRIRDVRIGMNACGAMTKEIVAEFAERHSNLVHVEVSNANIHKYPMMRRLFAVKPLKRLTAWFDDDSYIKVDDWYDRVVARDELGFDIAGAVYGIPLRGNQAAWIADQPWYRGKEFGSKYRVRFCTGGYWVIRSEILVEHGWPLPELGHRGGDVMLGELIRQQEYRLTHDSLGVAINADEQGRESKSPRRGYDETPIGVDYVPPKTRS